jgi:membrane-associated phospholipid phosphatase
MKLNTTSILLIIITLSAYHFYLHNHLEKLFSRTFFDYNDIRRPLKMCDSKMNSSRFYCTGMPSGHAEGSSVLAFLLYFYNFIPLWASLLFIITVSSQRVFSNKHTVLQVIIGSLLGFIYASIYKEFNLSLNGFLIVVTIGVLLTSSVLLKKHLYLK